MKMMFFHLMAADIESFGSLFYNTDLIRETGRSKKLYIAYK